LRKDGGKKGGKNLEEEEESNAGHTKTKYQQGLN
jgi:hypothetical protein